MRYSLSPVWLDVFLPQLAAGVTPALLAVIKSFASRWQQVCSYSLIVGLIGRAGEKCGHAAAVELPAEEQLPPAAGDSPVLLAPPAVRGAG